MRNSNAALSQPGLPVGTLNHKRSRFRFVTLIGRLAPLGLCQSARSKPHGFPYSNR